MTVADTYRTEIQASIPGVYVRRVRLKSISTNSGFLEDCAVNFSSQLTCLIGARGTCKSTVIESIRFAFGTDAERVQRLIATDGMITKTLGAGSIRCVLEVAEGNLPSVDYVIERETGGAPRVLRDGSRDPLAEDLLHEIEIYSQGSLQDIASSDKPQLRLQLIDRPNRVEIDRIRGDIAKTVADLSSVGGRLRSIRWDLDKRKLEARDGDQIRAELGHALETRPELPPTLEEQHTLYVARQRIVEILSELQALQVRTVASLKPVLASDDQLSVLRHLLDDLTGVEQVSSAAQLVDEVKAALEGIRIAIQSIESVPVGARSQSLAAAFEKQNETYYQLRQQQQAISESLKREESARRRLAELEKVEREIRQLDSEQNTLFLRRQVLRTEVARLRDLIFELRVSEAGKINEEFGDVILLAVKRAAHSREFVARLSTLLAGSRIRTQGNLAEELATNLSMSDLLQVIEDGDAQRLARLLSRDLGQITRLISYVRDHPDLYDLERNLPEDSLEITMFDQGQAKPVEELSEGQRATALLPLILRQSSCPLIVDQPEDDLDNSFIFQVLVKKVRQLKTTRQLVFVTHNANIPVLGEAEQIVVMHMARPTKAAPPRSGSLDDRKEDVLDLLEGGKEAFEYREKRYKDLLK